MSASNHEILSAVATAKAMSVEGLIVAAGYKIPQICSDDGFRNAVIRVAVPMIAELPDDDLIRCTRMTDRALDDALEVENAPPLHSDCDCWDDCEHSNEDEPQYVSDWLEVLFEALITACNERGIELDDDNDLEGQSE